MPRLRSLSRDRKRKTGAESPTRLGGRGLNPSPMSTPKRGSPKTLVSSTDSTRKGKISPKHMDSTLALSRRSARSGGDSSAKSKASLKGPLSRKKGGTVTPKKSISTWKTQAAGPGDVTHVIRVTVLGLAGITIDKDKCRSDQDPTSHLPARPSDMKAVIAFSRGAEIRGTTALSKPLARSPSEATSGTSSRERHVAVWASEDKTLGSTVCFEANLHRVVKTGTNNSSRPSSSFTPKSFELTVALTEENGDEHKVALPCGVSSLAVAGDECKNGQATTVDLPILSIAQARPLSSNKNGLGGYPMIAISPKKQDVEDIEAQLKKKRNVGLPRLFKRNGDNKFPSVTERKCFTSAYSMDASGDAVLRVALEIYEKGSDLEAAFVERRLRVATRRQSNPFVLSPPESTGRSMSLRVTQKSNLLMPISKSPSANEPVEEDCEPRGIEVPLEQIQVAPEEIVTPPADEQWEELKVTEVVETTETSQSPQATLPHTTNGVNEETQDTTAVVAATAAPTMAAAVVALASRSFSCGDGDPYNNEANSNDIIAKEADGKEVDEKNIEEDDGDDDDSIVTKEDNNVAYFQWTASGSKSAGTLNDSYTLSFTAKQKKSERTPMNEPRIALQDDDNIAIRIFGRDVKVPTCGLVHVFDRDSGDDRSLWTDEGTYVTAKLFGRQYQIPVARRAKKDGDTAASRTVRSERERSRLAEVLSMMCRRPRQSEKDLDLFSADEGYTYAGYTYADGSRTERGGESYLSMDYTMSWGDTLTMESLNPKEQEERKSAPTTPKTSSSPKGVLHFPGTETIDNLDPGLQDPDTSKPGNAPLGRSLAGIFACRYGFADDPGLRYEPYKEEVPPLIIPSNTDDMSVGDLTATTHEMQLAAEAFVSDRGVDNVSGSSIDYSDARTPLPLALGGLGLCSLGESAKSSPIRLRSNDSSSILDSDRDNENYFAEYAENDLWRPPIGSGPRRTKTPLHA